MNNLKYFLLFSLLVSLSKVSPGQFKIGVERKLIGDKCIMGYLNVQGKAVCYTLELPFKEKTNAFSSIPIGTYNAKIRVDGKKGWRIELLNVPDRENIQIHIGNFTSATTGCFLVGITANIDNCSVLDSKKALQKIEQEFISFKKELCLDCDATNEYEIIVDVK